MNKKSGFFLIESLFLLGCTIIFIVLIITAMRSYRQYQTIDLITDALVEEEIHEIYTP